MAVRCEEFRRCLPVEIGDHAGEVMGRAQEFKHFDQLKVVRRGKCAFEVAIAKDGVLFVCGSIFHKRLRWVIAREKER